MNRDQTTITRSETLIYIFLSHCVHRVTNRQINANVIRVQWTHVIQRLCYPVWRSNYARIKSKKHQILDFFFPLLLTTTLSLLMNLAVEWHEPVQNLIIEVCTAPRNQTWRRYNMWHEYLIRVRSGCSLLALELGPIGEWRCRCHAIAQMHKIPVSQPQETASISVLSFQALFSFFFIHFSFFLSLSLLQSPHGWDGPTC